MSLQKPLELLKLNVVSPEISDFSVLFDGDYSSSIGHQIKAVGLTKKLEETYGAEAYKLRKLDYFLQEYSKYRFHKELQHQQRVSDLKLQFPIGSIVMLMSGGPKMTVSGLTFSSDVFKIQAIFYQDNRELIKHDFIPDVLKLVKEKKDESDKDRLLDNTYSELSDRYTESLQRAMEHTKATT